MMKTLIILVVATVIVDVSLANKQPQRPNQQTVNATLQPNATMKPPEHTLNVTTLQSNATMKPPQRTGVVQTIEPTGTLKSPQKTETAKPPRPGKPGTVKPSQSTETLKSSQPTGTLKPPQNTGTVKPSQSTGTVKPPQNTGTVKPPQPTGTVKPPQNTGTVKPPQNTGTVKPSQSTGTVKPPKNTGTVKPPQNTGTVKPPQNTKPTPIATSTMKPTPPKPPKSTKNIEPSTSTLVPTTTPTTVSGEKVDGKWTTWSSWACAKCGTNNKEIRTRTCTNPKPSGGGKQCVGVAKEVSNTACKPCPEVTVTSQCKLPGEKYDDTMKNESSPAYKKYCGPGGFVESLVKAAKAKRARKCTLEPGSVVVKLELVFDVEGDANRTPVNYTKVIEDVVKTGNVGNFTVDPKSFVVSNVTVDGVVFGEWKTDVNLCTKLCCGAGNVAYENRTCTPTTVSCLGLIKTREIGCSPACDKHKKCDTSGGVDVQISAVVLVLVALLSLSLLH